MKTKEKVRDVNRTDLRLSCGTSNEDEGCNKTRGRADGRPVKPDSSITRARIRVPLWQKLLNSRVTVCQWEEKQSNGLPTCKLEVVVTTRACFAVGGLVSGCTVTHFYFAAIALLMQGRPFKYLGYGQSLEPLLTSRNSFRKWLHLRDIFL